MRRLGANRRPEEPTGDLRSAVVGTLGGSAPPWSETWLDPWAPSELDLRLFPSAGELHQPLLFTDGRATRPRRLPSRLARRLAE